MKWLTRSTKHCSRRVPVLVDAQAILGAAAKGRTSARSSSCDIRRIAVVTFSSNIIPAYVYIPSEDHPADAPSRNIQQRKLGKRGSRPVITKLPVKGKYAKPRASAQPRRVDWSASSDDLVNSILANRFPQGGMEAFPRDCDFRLDC